MWMMLNPPIGHLELLNQFGLTHHLVLTHLLQKSKKYKRFYKRLSKKKHWLTLDNSVMEIGEPIFDLDLASELRVSELVAPDYLFDKERTLEETSKFVHKVRELSGNQYQIMGVPQGRTSSDYFQCLLSMLENPTIDVIGIGKTATSAVTGILPDYPKHLKPLFGRLSVLTFICSEFSECKPIHILGLVQPEIEIPLYLQLPFIRSFDSSFPFRYYSSNKFDSSTDHEETLPSEIVRKCMSWVEKILSITGIEA